MDRHRRALEEFRHHYHIRHGIRLDDEVLFILMRVAHMHRELRREIRQRPTLQFRTSRDYLFYGMGRTAGILIPVLLLCVLLYHRR